MQNAECRVKVVFRLWRKTFIIMYLLSANNQIHYLSFELHIATKIDIISFIFEFKLKYSLSLI